MQYPTELENAQEIKIEANQTVFHQGDNCSNYILLTEGSVKVFARSPSGKEIILYFVKPGEVCVLTTSCLLSNKQYPAEAITETATTAKIIPKQKFDKLIDSSKIFRQFVFSSLSLRLSSLISLVEQIALESIEQRLANHLLLHCSDQKQIKTTHHDIATEIGSAREVISRNLKTFEKNGWINIDRGLISLSDVNALRNLVKIK
jgi:CRP/FNR family transcriptional regulator, anaerobic regulatory protein